MQKSDWLCVNCGEVLGQVLGGELHPSTPSSNLRTSGPNLLVTCPKCGAHKVWYTADPVVRAIYQLINAISDVTAESVVRSVGQALHTQGK